MRRHLHQPEGDLPSSEWLGEFAGALAGANVARDRQTVADIAEAKPHRPPIAMPARVDELRRLLGATIAENKNLTARVRDLEADLRRSSAELARLRGQLRGAMHDALTDPLTGLANRRAFDLELRAIAARASRSSPAHLVLADIDHLKRVNDTHGHTIGDEVLCIVGEVLLANVRRDTLVARLGGDEFGLLLPRASPHYVAGIVSRLGERMASRPLVVRGSPRVVLRITLSIGVAGWQPGESSGDWHARADTALYRAKRRGRNRVAVDDRRHAAARVPAPGAAEAAAPD